LLLTLSMAQFMVVLDFTIVNVALPSIQAGLHVTTTTHRITGHPRPPPSAHRHSRR
jgi:MFS family permease